MMRGHRYVGEIAVKDRARHFSQPRMPRMPEQTPPPPQRSDADAAAAAQREAAREARGRRSTIIAGGQAPETLGKVETLGGANPGGASTLLGGR